MTQGFLCKLIISQLLTSPHSVTAQKTKIDIFTVVRTSNLLSEICGVSGYLVICSPQFSREVLKPEVTCKYFSGSRGKVFADPVTELARYT
jgi:hypothetical protein